MLNRIKDAAHKAKDYVVDNRGKLIAVVAIAGHVAVMMKVSKETSEFLTEKGIDPLEFYNKEYYEEQQES